MPDIAVVALAIGSRGDVEPMAVLAGRLTARGVPAAVIAADEYGGLVRRWGARFHGFGFAMTDFERRSESPLNRLALRSPTAYRAFLQSWIADHADAVAGLLDDLVEPGSLVLCGLPGRDSALALVQARGAAMATVLHTGVLPTVQRESFIDPRMLRGTPAMARRATGLWWSGISLSGSRALRDRLGVPSGRWGRQSRDACAAADAHPILMAVSPTLVPPAPDWPATTVVTGSIVAEVGDWSPPSYLSDFLVAGLAPVFVGLGSLGVLGGSTWLEELGRAARKSGRRVVTPAPRGQMPGLVDEWVCTVGEVPHEWLFPRMRGVVHHGGSGTTVTGLRSGRPSVIVPVSFDQPYHARRLVALGVGPAPVPWRRLDPPRLAGLIGELTSGRYDEAAVVVGERVRAEPGLDQAMQVVLDLVR